MTDSFWKSTNVYTPTLGDEQAIPYHHLPGSDVGLDSPQIEEGSDALFPALDGSTSTLPGELPVRFEDLTADLFMTLHLAHQNQYIVEHGTDDGVLNITNGGTITAVRSENGREVFIVENLQKNDFALMTLADQERIAGTLAFRTNTGPRLGLLPIDGNVANARAEMIDLIKEATEGMESAHGKMADEDLELFTDQLVNLKTRLEGTGVFSETVLAEKIKDIKDRFDRAAAFINFTEQSNTANPPQIQDVKSLDGEATIKNGYAMFIEQEKRIRDLDNQRLGIAQTGAATGTGPLGDRSLDVPTLIFLFQFHYNLGTEAKVAMKTEEIQQQNKLLQDYAAMQAVVNRTLGLFDATGDGAADDTRKVLGAADFANIAAEDQLAIQMFEDLLTGSSSKHPLETLRGLPPRPELNMFNNGENIIKEENLFLKTQWDAFATELSDAVSLINQQTQILMNEVNSMDKEKNRHFDMANNALRKMADMIQTIAR